MIIWKTFDSKTVGGTGGFLLPFWQVTCECVCRWGQEHQLLGGRWYQATTFYPVEQTQTLEKMPALIPLVILLGGLDGDKEKEVVQDRCHQGTRWSQLLIYNLQVLYSGKRCVSVIDVSSCYLPPDIEDSPVSGGAEEEEVFRSKIFFDITSFFSPHGIILSCGLRWLWNQGKSEMPSVCAHKRPCVNQQSKIFTQFCPFNKCSAVLCSAG